MAAHDEFLRAIRAAPADDTPRLVYADWLEEVGQAERAQFIRLQCEYAPLPRDGGRRRELKEQAYELLRRNARAWGVPGKGWGKTATFRRGFIERIVVDASAGAGGRPAPVDPTWLVLPTVQPDRMDVPLESLWLVPASVASELCCIPVGHTPESLTLAVPSLEDPSLFLRLSVTLNRAIEPVLAAPGSIRRAIERHYGSREMAVASVFAEYTKPYLTPNKCPSCGVAAVMTIPSNLPPGRGTPPPAGVMVPAWQCNACGKRW